MPKCPRCNSDYAEENEVIYDENGWEIYVTRRHYCWNCNCHFSLISTYTCNDEYEELEIEEK